MSRKIRRMGATWPKLICKMTDMFAAERFLPKILGRRGRESSRILAGKERLGLRNAHSREVLRPPRWPPNTFLSPQTRRVTATPSIFLPFYPSTLGAELVSTYCAYYSSPSVLHHFHCRCTCWHRCDRLSGPSATLEKVFRTFRLTSPPRSL